MVRVKVEPPAIAPPESKFNEMQFNIIDGVVAVETNGTQTHMAVPFATKIAAGAPDDWSLTNPKVDPLRRK